MPLGDYLISIGISIARYDLLEPAFEYEGWYDERLGEIRGHWFWPGFHFATEGRRSWLQIGAMRGLWRMTKEGL